MNDETLKQLLMVLRAIAGNNPPNWQRPLKSYTRFDWNKVGATVVDSDQYGATQVSWCGHIYTRRGGENKKFGAAIWFSRIGRQDENGEAVYLRLITFKQLPKAEPLPEYVVRSLH